ncbi:dienelactone hydrolase family protein [Tepidimonas charontis]|uniref:Carboxymethylenebutenolidase n=1 Tax=Tepidimonas charontis TaxID=2267262 RepID=A0A554XL14_9BURK|nr:dienelactone hydrolase family protein [Tepidimonas charontis]TSE36525.1 Carboxymethylenebutenolidase [Tepidimonas charontis]
MALTTTQTRDLQALLDAAPDVPAAAPNRRAVLRAALGVGYCAAAAPLVAQTAIRTPADGLVAGEVSMAVGGTSVPVYRAAPAGRTGLPVILVISEIFGVHEYIADTARRFARAGYLALAPDLFVRQGDPQSYGELARLLSELIAKVPDAQVMGDLDACVDWAAANGGDVARLAVTGFCWGGRQTWLYAAHSPRVKAAVAWYGRLEGERNALQPQHPIDVVGVLKAPVLGLYGAADTGIPLASVERMKAALAQGSPAARASTFVVYPDAPHAFHADYRPSYRAEPAQDGWRRCLDWLRQHGVV